MSRFLHIRGRKGLGALLLSLGLLLGASAVCAQSPLADGQVVEHADPNALRLSPFASGRRLIFEVDIRKPKVDDVPRQS
jgi:hypothetical protein